MKRFGLPTAAVAAAVLVCVGLTLPPAHRTLPPPPWSDGTVPGIVHVHTVRSDGRGTPVEVAGAAARAGLKFVVFTDHGDATRPPDPPAYHSGVLCLDGVEISTTGGHYVAIGMPAAPYPLGGDPRDVVEDVARLGGFGIVAHPASPKPALRWREWTAPFDAMETLNLDTSWRLWAARRGWRGRLRLAAALFDYPVRPAETIANLLLPTDARRRWAALAARRRVVTIGGADAHAKLALRNTDPGDNRFSLPVPGYEASFRTLSVHVRPARPLTGRAVADAAALLQGIRDGHLYTSVDGLAAPAAFELTAANQQGTARAGDEIAEGGALRLHVRTNAPSAFTIKLWKGMQLLASRSPADVTLTVPGAPGAYWASIESSDPTPIAWVESNAVYVRAPGRRPSLPARPAATATDRLFDGASASGWRVEHDASSVAAVEAVPSVGGRELRFRFGLGGGPASAQYAALVVDRPAGLAGDDRVALTLRAERPMRVSVQLRAPTAQGTADRWARSTYVDVDAHERTIFFDELTPTAATRSWRPDLQAIRSVLIVVDTTHTRPRTSGRLWVKAAALGRR